MTRIGMKQPLFRLATIAAVVLAVSAFATPAKADMSTPTSGTASPWAANVDLGFTNQSGDGNFDAHALLGASIERYSSENVSWRGAMSMHSFGDPAFQQPFRTVSNEDITAFNGNVLYHWTGSNAQPFVTGGVGYYDYQHTYASHHSEAGIDFGGGIDVFATSTVAIKFEALYHQTTADTHDTFVAGSAGIRFRW